MKLIHKCYATIKRAPQNTEIIRAWSCPACGDWWTVTAGSYNHVAERKYFMNLIQLLRRMKWKRRTK